MNGNATLFSIPNVCPSVVLPACPNLEYTSVPVLEPICEDLGLEAKGSTTKVPKNVVTPNQKGKAIIFDQAETPKHKGKGKGKGKPPLSEVDVRRSMRLKLINKGFKFSSSSCKDKNCLGYVAKPPTISPKVIKNLGSTFYGIDPTELTTSKLNAKPVANKKKRKAVKTKDDASTSQRNEDHDATSSQSSNNGATDPSTQMLRPFSFAHLLLSCQLETGLFLVGMLGE